MGNQNIHKLTATGIAKLKKVAYHSDGGGLYIQVVASGAKTWIFRYTRRGNDNGTRPEMGLGSAQSLTLAQARVKAAFCRNQLAIGIDPLTARTAGELAARLVQTKTITFSDAATQYIDMHEASWRNAKHVAQWRSTLNRYCGPVFGDIAVADVDRDLVFRVLEPIWSTKSETASRLRGRIESVLGWAKSKGYRTGDNPAAWKGHLDAALPATNKVKQVTHHAALPFSEMGQFITALRDRVGIAARALEFGILTAVRSGEVRGAKWDEIDLSGRKWTIPAARMKMKIEHSVPLSAPAVSILEEMKKLSLGDFIFPGSKDKKPLSDMTLMAVLKRMDRTTITVHGFRSTFRDWTSECTNHTREVVEMSLAHAIDNKTEAAYRRGKLFEKRAILMADWAEYCGTVTVSGIKVA